jgi:hypothetical protein
MLEGLYTDSKFLSGPASDLRGEEKKKLTGGLQQN